MMPKSTVLYVVLLLSSPAGAAGTQFSLKPVEDLPYLDVTHRDLPGQVFRWRVPEYVSTHDAVIPRQVLWRQESPAKWALSWKADPETKRRYRRDFRGTVTAGADTLDFEVQIENPFDAGWSTPDYWIISFVCGQADQFHDPHGRRTYIRQDGKLRTVRQVRGRQFKPQEMGTFNLNLPKDSQRYDHRTDASFIARVSKDGQWVVAAVGDTDAGGPGYNLYPSTSCLNTNYPWGRLGPGQSKIARFRVYLFKGGVEDAWRRYLKDYPQVKLVVAEQEAKRQTAVDDSEQQRADNLTIDTVEITTGVRADQHAIPSVWAPATSLAALAGLHAKRPAGCQADALLCWLADLAIRDGQSVDLQRIQRERARFEDHNGFLVRDDDSGLWIANGKVGLHFAGDRNKCRLISFYDLQHGIELIHRKPPNGSPLRIQVLRYRQDGTTGVLNFRQDGGDGPDVSFVTEVDARGASKASHRVRVAAEHLTVDLEWSGIRVDDTPGELHATATVRLDKGDPLTRWRARVTGDLPRAGISQVRCPVLPNLGYRGQCDLMYCWGSQRGIFKRADTSVSRGAYPSSQWAMQHLSISFGPAVSLYVAAHDGASYVKSFRWDPGKELYLSAYAPNTGVMGNAAYEQPYDVVIGPIQGGWFDSAKRYRRWAVAHAPWARPLKDRDDVSHRMLKVAYWARCSWFHDDGSDGEESWSFDQSMMRVPPRETVEWYRRVLGVPYERLGAIHYGWQQQVWDTRLPYWTPIGPQVAEELQRETRLGMSTYIYTNPCWYDPQAPGFNDEVKKAITRNIDGSMYFEQYNAKMYEISRATPLFRKVLADLAQLARRMNSNGIYYDQISGMLRGGDYDPNKGLPSLGRGGNWLPLAKQRAMRQVRKKMGPDFGFVSEFYCETAQDLYDVQSVTIHSDPLEGPLLPAVYSGYVVQHGAGLHHKTRPTASVIALGHNFLWGTSFGWTQFCTDLKRCYTRLLLKQLVQLRIQLDDFLVYGEMLRPPPFAGPVPKIKVDYWNVYGQERKIATYDAYEAALWRGDDGRRVLLVVNYDKKPHDVAFALGDLKATFDAIELLQPANGVKMRIEGRKLVLVMPGRTGAAIILPKNEIEDQSQS